MKCGTILFFKTDKREAHYIKRMESIMQRIAFIQTIGVILMFGVPVFIAKEFYFISLACLLSSIYFVIRGEQVAYKLHSHKMQNANKIN